MIRSLIKRRQAPKRTKKKAISKRPEMKLKPRLVPSPIWHQNLRRHLGQHEWLNTISRPVRLSAGQKCEICGGKGEGGPSWPLCCDEIWNYDDKKRVATLIGFQSICWKCNDVIHSGNSSARIQSRTHDIDEIKEAMEELELHAIRVNGISKETWMQTVSEERKIWKKRSSFRSWKINLSNWKKILQETFDRHKTMGKLTKT